MSRIPADLKAFAMRSAICAFLLSTSTPTASTQELNLTSQRRDVTIEKLTNRYNQGAECDVDATGDKSRCMWRDIVKAILALKIGSNSPVDPDQVLSNVATQLPVTPGWKRLSDPEKPATSKRLDPAWDFPFLTATLLFRGAEQFGPASNYAGQNATSHHIKEATLNAIENVFWLWANTECRLSDAGDEYMWALWSTENHDAQRSHACWASSELLSKSPLFKDKPYSDGSTASQQRDAWSSYFKKLIRARANAGISIEFFSPTYSKYLLSVFYNLFDFASDPELRSLSGRYISLWWALWAHEQQNGVHGGGKTRFYFNQNPDDTPMSGVPWLYFGEQMDPSGADQLPNAIFLLSNYTPPSAVSCIVAAQRARRSGSETWSQAVGLSAAPVPGRPTSISDRLAISRYTYSAPGFVMGSVIVPRLRNNQWAAISSQNRWSGVVLEGGLGHRVFAAPARGRQRSMYNAVATVQSRGTQIIGRLKPPFSREAGPMEIRFGSTPAVVEKGGWIFSEGSAYVAARPAFGGYSKIDDTTVYRLAEPDAPVIIQAASKLDYATFPEFQNAVMRASLKADAVAVEFDGLDGAGKLRFNLEGEQVAYLNGQPVAAPKDWLYKGDFIRQRVGHRQTEIACGSEKLNLDF